MVNANLIKDKIVAVTGAGRGIGLALVKQLLDQGNTVIATARQPPAAAPLQELVSASGNRLHITQLDTSSPESIADWAQGLKEITKHLDVLINNAGIFQSGTKMLAELNQDTLLNEFKVNAVGPVLVTQQLIKAELLGGQAKSLVVNMSSNLSSIGGDVGWKGGYGYRGAKAALNMFSTVMVQELSDKNIDLVLMHPGFVDTDMTEGQDHTGIVQAPDSANGIIKVLESGRELNGKLLTYEGKELPW